MATSKAATFYSLAVLLALLLTISSTEGRLSKSRSYCSDQTLVLYWSRTLWSSNNHSFVIFSYKLWWCGKHRYRAARLFTGWRAATRASQSLSCSTWQLSSSVPSILILTAINSLWTNGCASTGSLEGRLPSSQRYWMFFFVSVEEVVNLCVTWLGDKFSFFSVPFLLGVKESLSRIPRIIYIRVFY